MFNMVEDRIKTLLPTLRQILDISQQEDTIYF